MEKDKIHDVIYETINKYFFNGEYYGSEKIQGILKEKYGMNVSLDCIERRIKNIIDNT